jgi:type III restriction enzyme
VEGGHNKCYVKLLSASNKKGKFTAKVELDVKRLLGVCRETVTVQPGDDLEQVTGRAVYADCLVQAIGCGAGDEYLELNNQEKVLRMPETTPLISSPPETLTI